MQSNKVGAVTGCDKKIVHNYINFSDEKNKTKNLDIFYIRCTNHNEVNCKFCMCPGELLGNKVEISDKVCSVMTRQRVSHLPFSTVGWVKISVGLLGTQAQMLF